MNVEPALTMVLVFLPLVVTLALIGGLTAFAARRAQAPGATAARLATLSFVLAVVGSLCLVFWPLWLGSSVSGSVSFDPSTGQTVSSSEQHLTVTWFPYIRQLGARLISFALLPVAFAAAPTAWQRAGLPGPRVLRVAAAVGLLGWLVIGSISGVSWWSLPAAVTMVVAAARRS